MESFLGQLSTATQQIPPADKATLMDAISFLGYAAGDRVRETEPERFAKWQPNDVAAHAMLKM